MKNHMVKALHTGISVSDMERSLKWYSDVLGFEPTGKDFYAPPLGARISFIRGLGGYEIELFQYDAPKAIPEDRLKPNSDLQTIGTKHLAIQVADMAGFKEKAVAYGIAECTPEEIDEYNILNASMLAMRRAVEKLAVKADFALIDGNCSRGFTIPTETVVKGDAKSASIAAASILAKVTRDRGCEELDRQYPMYGIAKHKGYPTKDHMNAVREHGVAPIYRRSFLKFLDKE